MTFEISPVQLLVISAIVNCFIYSVLILFKKENRRANVFLTLLLVSLCLTFTPYIIPAQVFNDNLWLTWMPFSLTYWIGPALYFYVKSLTNPHYTFPKSSLWHFSLIILNYLHSIYHLVVTGFPYQVLHYTAEFLEFAAIFSILIYAYLSMKVLRQYYISILQQLSTIEHLHLKWIKNLIWILISIFTLIAIYLVVTNEVLEKNFPGGIIGAFRQFFLAGYAIMLYWLSIGGFKQTQIINSPFAINGKNKSNNSHSDVLAKIRDVMNAEKLYRDPQLSLKGLSAKCGISEKQITSFLNNKLERNFYTFVNEFRVKEVKEKLCDSNYDHLKILTLAYDAGFNSKATFNRIFKEYEGMTPQEFRRQQKTLIESHLLRPQRLN